MDLKRLEEKIELLTNACEELAEHYGSCDEEFVNRLVDRKELARKALIAWIMADDCELSGSEPIENTGCKHCGLEGGH